MQVNSKMICLTSNSPLYYNYDYDCVTRHKSGILGHNVARKIFKMLFNIK
jgi:hypothetical protein